MHNLDMTTLILFCQYKKGFTCILQRPFNSVQPQDMIAPPLIHIYRCHVCLHFLLSPDEWRCCCHCRLIKRSSSSSLDWPRVVGLNLRATQCCTCRASLLVVREGSSTVYSTIATSRVETGVVQNERNICTCNAMNLLKRLNPEAASECVWLFNSPDK